MQVRNYIFDLDGTLSDSKQGIIASLGRTLTHFNRPIPPAEDLDWAIGPPLPVIMSRLMDDFTPSQVQEAVEVFRRHYRAEGYLINHPFPGIPEMLADLASAGVRLFVATSKFDPIAREVLALLKLADRFEIIQGSIDNGPLQHKENIIKKVLEDGDLPLEETIMVGDREHDIIAAKANRLFSVGVTWGYGDREELLSAGADQLCDRPPELLPAIDRP